MRLLYLVPEPWPTFRADVAALFGKYLPRHGIYSDLVTGRMPAHQGKPADWGGGAALLCELTGGKATKHITMLLHSLRWLLSPAVSRYSAIQVRDMPVIAVFGLVVARLRSKMFFYWMSFPMPEGQIELARERGLSAGLMKFLFPFVRGRVGRFLLYRVVLPCADHIFVQSEHMRQVLAHRGIPPDKMTPVPMGVDLEAMTEEIPPVDDPRLLGRRVLVYLGTLDRPRRIETLFDMLAEVRRRVPEALLVLVGDTEDDVHRDWLRRRAVQVGVAEHVVWTGWLPMREGWRYVRSAEVGLSPIPRGPLLDVGSPTKVLEYLVLGVPVVGNDNPDQQAIIEASGCGRCVPYTAQAFAQAVVELLSLGAGELRQMAAAGAAHVRATRSYAVLSEHTARIYRRLLAAQPAAVLET